MIYYTADLHFGHKNVIDLCGRPFGSVEEMDETLISNWNRKVKRGDTVYIIGDIASKSKLAPSDYISRLNGKKILVVGNHDSLIVGSDEKNAFFSCVTDCLVGQLENRTVTLCHYPMLEWKNSRKEGSPRIGFLIHGHIHNRKDELFKPLFLCGNALNAGVDINGFEPVNFTELEHNNEGFKLSALENQVDKALYICRKYHMCQCDKSGVAYANHPMYVASEFTDENLKTVALLHDVLEDTKATEELLRKHFTKEVVDAVCVITRHPDEDYFDYILRVRENTTARLVKLADLEHNMDMSRLKTVTNEDSARCEKYCKAYGLLLNI